MNEIQRKFLEKAQKSLDVAKQINNTGYAEFAVVRAYYTMFYVASAFLEGEDLSYSKHSAIISAFGQHFAKTERVPKIFHRYLIEAEKLRKGADYSLDIEISFEEANQVIIQAEEMLIFALNNLV
jgi:uncharacterized protein (UPF0332 family)